MAAPEGKKKKPIAVVYEVPHKPQVQEVLLNIRKELEKAGWQVFFQNPQLYRSDQMFTKAQLVIYYDKGSTANAELFVKDYTEKKIDVVDHQKAFELFKPKKAESKKPAAEEKESGGKK